MKLKSYFLLSIMAGMAFACSSDEDIPEAEEVFTPDATLSLAAVADEKALTKAGEGTTTDPEDMIHSLHVMVFNAGDGTLQNDTVVSSGTGSSISKVEDLQVQSGDVKILVMANAGTTEGNFKTLNEALEHQRSLSDETTDKGFSMSSRLIEANLKKGMHNVFGESGDFSDHIPAIKLEGPILLTRHIAQINLVSVSISSATDCECESFTIDSVFVANVKGYSKMAANSDEEWGAVESSKASDGGSLWWYGNCHEDSWKGKYKTTTNGLLKKDLLGFSANGQIVTSASSWTPATGERACGKSFIVYENMADAATLGQRTLLVLKGTYKNKNGRVEENRFYTISVNDPETLGLQQITGTGEDDAAFDGHNYIKRNYRYNISLTIKSSGSDRPYDPASEACMNVAVQVADWNVVVQDEKLD